MFKLRCLRWLSGWILWASMSHSLHASLDSIAPAPLFTGRSAPPLIMLIMDRSHRLYTAAYDDASDINQDGNIEYHFVPELTYDGYFDPNLCYQYNAATQYFYVYGPSGTLKQCPGAWSGNFLNYLTMSKMDLLRKNIYGGYRVVDTPTTTILERALIPQDGHTFGKEYSTYLTAFYDIGAYTPFSVPAGSQRHLFINTTRQGVPLLRVINNSNHHLLDWIGIPPPSGDQRFFDGQTGPEIIEPMVDYVVRIKACDVNAQLESYCKRYSDHSIKPVGILQAYGEEGRAYFGLMSGSYDSNLVGGTLRQNIQSIGHEINPETGQFINTPGIIQTMNHFIFNGFNSNFMHDCGFITTRAMTNGECSMWGNPLSNMMYETLRYFSGKTMPTGAYQLGQSRDQSLQLPAPSWESPYTQHPRCSPLMSVVLSSGDPNYDSTHIPGSAFEGLASDLNPSLNSAQLGQEIFNHAGLGTDVLSMIGQSGASGNFLPTAKNVSSFGTLQGINPAEAYAQGGYYSASVAYYGQSHLINGQSSVKTLVYSFANPAFPLEFIVNQHKISVMPIGKSVQGLGIMPEQGQYQPNNEIITYHIESLDNQAAVIHINFSNVEQGGTYSQGAQVTYTIQVLNNSSLQINTVTNSSSGALTQHLGYVLSGTQVDGVYLVVKDTHTDDEHDIQYYLDTPSGVAPGGLQPNSPALTTSDTRTFLPGSNTTTQLRSPLWYAARWGGFLDFNNNQIPDSVYEFSSQSSGQPDNYILANGSQQLGAQLSQALQQTIQHRSALTSPVLSSATLRSHPHLYQALFQYPQWSGDLVSHALSEHGDAIAALEWSAQQQLQTKHPDSRQILTYQPISHKGIAFSWQNSGSSSGLSEAQKQWLNTNPSTGQLDGFGEERLKYLRGSQNKEIAQTHGMFRARSSLLGDIIHSQPVYVGKSAPHYSSSWNTTDPEHSGSYLEYLKSLQGEPNMIYVGANDGMLHAFNAAQGDEVFAYVPHAVSKNLAKLSSPFYEHQYYVDGTPTVADAWVNGGWKRILVGHLNGGGQGIYALDITHPSQISEATAENTVLWEFSDQNDADMGYSFSQPLIVRLHHGQWAAIFGNGYQATAYDASSSSSGNAILYVVDLATGELIKKFDTQQGRDEDPEQRHQANGMSSPAVVSATGNDIADYIYVGDLFGNLWKIDVTSLQPQQWHFSFESNGKPVPLFKAQNADGQPQPITMAPTLMKQADPHRGIMIYFGTGKYLNQDDVTDASIQSVYALIDQQNTPLTKNALLQQTLTQSQETSRTVSQHHFNTTHLGWYLDLPPKERANSKIMVRHKKVFFTTLAPLEDVCAYGGLSWMMILRADDGGALNYHSYQLKNTAASTEKISGIQLNTGITALPAMIHEPEYQTFYFTGSNGEIQIIQAQPGYQTMGKQSWQSSP